MSFSLFRRSMQILQPMNQFNKMNLFTPKYNFSSEAASLTNAVNISDFEPEVRKEALTSQIREFCRAYGTGRRKSSAAVVFVKDGSGQIMINGRTITDYFQFHLRKHAMEALEFTDSAGKFDIHCTVNGGGVSGQAGAIRLGVARAIEAYEPSLRPLLKSCKCCLYRIYVYLMSPSVYIYTQTVYNCITVYINNLIYVPLYIDGLLTRDARSVERKKIGQKKARKKFQWVKRQRYVYFTGQIQWRFV